MNLLLLKLSNEELDIIKFWIASESSSNVLKDIAKKLSISCAPSVASERIFASTGNLTNDKRTTLREEKVDMMTFLKNNAWLKSTE